MNALLKALLLVLLAVCFYLGGYVAAVLPFGSRRHGATLVAAVYAVLAVTPPLLYWAGVTTRPELRITIYQSPDYTPPPPAFSWQDLVWLIVTISVAFGSAWMGGKRGRSKWEARAGLTEPNAPDGAPQTQ